ncbi:class I SAM-dependent methyltransferase [bacterium]|nr:class I SAM-dependent methyltransferase [bacterium]
MKSLIKKLINPIELIKAYKFHKKQKKHIKSSQDLELMLYSKIIKTDMLHYGYFDDINIKPDSISIKDLENAQMNYVDIIIKQILNKNDNILDVGCGMGGLSKILFDNNLKVQALTPDNNQKEYIKSKYPNLILHHMKFENFKSKEKFGTIINSESLQYIDLDTAFELVSNLLIDNGRWIVTDYFRNTNKGINKSGHLHKDFIEKINKKGWEIVYKKDMTLNALPTLKFAMTFINRFLSPLALFINEKIKHKQGWLFYLTKELRIKLSNKSKKELAALDPDKFITEKKYMLYVLERK